MRKNTSIVILFITLITIGCKSSTTNTVTDTAHNSKNALDWAGNYEGTLPCADCEGIQTNIKLNYKDSFIVEYNYLGKEEPHFSYAGKIEWSADGNKISLREKNNVVQYIVGENVLIQLDLNGNKIEGELAENYQLRKLFNNPLVTDKYWKLIELNGRKINTEQQLKEAHFKLISDDNRIVGNDGCNSFFGTYQLLPGDRIQISTLGSTKMACLNDNVEDEFLKVLAIADNYALKNDTLSLNKAKMTPLARFELAIKQH